MARFRTVMAILVLTTGAAAASPREQAVLQARAGDAAGGIASLRAQMQAGSRDPLVAMDLVALLQQNGHAAEAAAVFEQAHDPAPPEYALLAATRAYRDLRRYNEAARLARQGLQRFPGSDVWPVLLALVLADAGQTDLALETLRQKAAHARPIERKLAEAYAHRQAGDPWAALRAYAEALQMDPRNAEARTETAGILRELRGPFGAAALVPPSPALQADQAASMVTWGADIRSPDPARRFDGTDAAIARLDALIAAQRAAPEPDQALLRRLRFDRMVAYRDRVRMADVAQEADSLRQSGAELPLYAREALADALLYLRRPEEAAAEYDAVLAVTPRELNPRYGRFYAAVESEDFGTAYAIADAILADSPIWHWFGDSPARVPNPDYTEAALRAAQVRLWGNQVADGWARLDPLTDAAPANQMLRAARGGAMNMRTWPRAADTEAQIAASLRPDDLGAQIAQAESAMLRHRLAEAEARTDALVRLYPENLSVQRLARELDAQNRFLLEAEVRPANTTGGGIWAAGQEMDSTFALTSPPIHENWRVFALGSYAYAHPVEGYVSRLMAGAGLEWRAPDWTVRGYATGNGGTLSRGGAGASVQWAPSDQITLSAGGQIFSSETPLRALLYGITANEVSASAAYRWNETRAVTATVAYLPFSDGNQRLTGGLGISQLLYARPHFDVTGRLDLYASRNTKEGAPYFNPRADVSATAGLTIQHIIWRRYDHSWTQVLALDGGSYTERGYGTGWIGVASYEHRWRFDPLTEFYYGASLSRRIYDGSPEKAVTFLFGIRQRL